jgi:hypothetical protein
MAGPVTEKTFHLAFCLPLFGLALLMPPALLVFALPVELFGLPLIVLYIFGIWASLIGAAVFLARRLRPDAAPPSSDGPGRAA